MRLPSAVLVATAGCYSPSYDPCAVSCEQGDVCPGETSCATDGFCHHAGEAPCPVDGPMPDVASADGPLSDALPRPVPSARLGLTAFRNANSWSPGMSLTDYSVPTDSIAAGDLVLFLASVDNGSGTVWPDPVADGFTNLAHQYYGPDGQSFVVAWKIATADEPVSYDGVYGPGIASGSATIALVVVTGATTVGTPVVTLGSTATDPVPADSLGVTTDVDDSLVLYFAGVDWVSASGLSAVSPPTGYTELLSMGDHGDAGFDWTSIEISTAPQPLAGPTGLITTSFDAAIDTGVAFTVVLAIPPG